MQKHFPLRDIHLDMWLLPEPIRLLDFLSLACFLTALPAAVLDFTCNTFPTPPPVIATQFRASFFTWDWPAFSSPRIE